MDPLLFGIKGDVVTEALGTIVLLSVFVERTPSPLFEWRPVLNKIKDKGLKEPKREHGMNDSKLLSPPQATLLTCSKPWPRWSVRRPLGSRPRSWRG
jgi:hypothetical protein